MLARLFAHALAPLAALVPLAVLVLSCGCSGDDVTPISGECPEATFSALPAAHHKLDVLIVADTSARMAARWAAWDAGAQPLASALLDALRDARFGVDPDATTACSALDRRGCALPDLRVGVVSADLGAPGVAGCDAQGQGAALRAPGPGCATLADDWLAVSAAQSNVQDAPGSSGSTRDDIEIAAGCLLGRAALGSAPGCAVAQPLEAARRAVSAQNGFLRDDAALLLLVLSASDDCSSDDAARLFDAATTGLGAATPHRCLVDGARCGGGDAKALLAPGALSDCRARDTPDHLRPLAGLVDALRALRTPRRLAVGVIAADGARIEIVAGASSDVAATSACGAGGADALPSPRLSSFARSFGADGLLLSPCDDTPQLLAGNLAPRLLSRCVDAPVVTETGLACREDDQYGKAKSAVCDDRTLHLARCTVRETSGGSTRDIARCAPPLFYPHDDVPAENDCGADCPCWRLVRDSVACGGVGGSAPPYRLEVLRAGEAPAGTVVDFSCRHATRPWGDDALGDASQICQ